MTISLWSGKIPIAVSADYGGIAQLARACGSYPQCPRFESRCRYQTRAQTFLPAPFIRPVGQVVKTPPFHGGNMGSSPVRVTTAYKSELFLPSWRWVRILLYCRQFPPVNRGSRKGKRRRLGGASANLVFRFKKHCSNNAEGGTHDAGETMP